MQWSLHWQDFQTTLPVTLQPDMALVTCARPSAFSTPVPTSPPPCSAVYSLQTRRTLTGAGRAESAFRYAALDVNGVSPASP